MRALVVDDEQNIRRTLTVALESMGYEATNAATGADALGELKARRFDVMLLDLKLSQESGLDVLEEAIRISPALAVVMMTAFASIETAVEAMRRGAFDYLPKPCTPEQLRQVLGRIQKTRKLERRVAELESRLSADSPEIDLTTHSPAMEKAFDVAFKAAGTDATVLLLGESGTGKSVLARAIHQRSSRNSGAFVTVSCPSLTRELLQSELFGHVKGAFTGALAETWGKVTAAEGGTLFLDEVGDLPSGDSGQAAAFAPRARIRTSRRNQTALCRRASHRGEQSRPGEDRESGNFSRRSLLQTQRHLDYAAATARPVGRRRAVGDGSSSFGGQSMRQKRSTAFQPTRSM